jgi:hypothetical protein
MAWGDKIYVMATLTLQADHHCRKLTVIGLDPFAQVADIKILAKDTEQIAVGDEYGP